MSIKNFSLFWDISRNFALLFPDNNRDPLLPMPRERRINVRAKGDLKDRLRRACQITGASESSLVAACVESLVNYVESYGELTLPLAVVPKNALKELRALSILATLEDGETGRLSAEGVRGSWLTSKSGTNSDHVGTNKAQVPSRKTRKPRRTEKCGPVKIESRSKRPRRKTSS